MKEPRGLRTAIQAIGVYFLCQAAYNGINAIGHFLAGRYFYPDMYTFMSSPRNALFYGVLQYLIMAAAQLLIAGVLLAKTDWSVKTVIGFSRPRAMESGAGEAP